MSGMGDDIFADQNRYGYAEEDFLRGDIRFNHWLNERQRERRHEREKAAGEIIVKNVVEIKGEENE